MDTMVAHARGSRIPRLIRIGLIAAIIAALCQVPNGFGQPPGGQPGGKDGQRGRAGGPGGFGGAMGRAFDNLDSVKKQIKATDEEWKVIAPKLNEVISARRATEISNGPASGFGFGGFGPPGAGGFGPPGGGPGGFGPPGGGPGGPGGFGRPGFGPPGGGPGGGFPFGGAPLNALNLSADQKPKVESLQKEFEEGLASLLTEDQNRQYKELPGFLRSTPFELLPGVQDALKLSDEQMRKLDSLQKKVQDKFSKILTEEQGKRWKEMREAMARGLPPGGPPGGPGNPAPGGPPAGGPGNPPPAGSTPVASGGGRTSDSATNQALGDLKAAIDDSKTAPAELAEKVAAVRAARKKARDRLAAAQKELLLLITPDQEAVLVQLGYLD